MSNKLNKYSEYKDDLLDEEIRRICNKFELLDHDLLVGYEADEHLDLSLLKLEDLTDPGADKIVFWDDSETKCDWLTVGTGLSISGTTLSCTLGAAGADTQVQYNDSGAFGADSNLTYDKSGNLFAGTSVNVGTDYTAGYNINGSRMFWTPTVDNVYIGINAGNTGDYNVAIGQNALLNDTGGYHVAIGGSALYSNTTGSYCVAIGSFAGYRNTGWSNFYLGASAGYYQGTGSNSVLIGIDANKGTGVFNASNNVGIGYQAIYKNTASGTVGIGYHAAYNLTSGIGITAVGYRAAYSIVGNSQVTAFGYEAAYSNTNAHATAFGYQALYSASGADCCAFGCFALRSNTGANNTAFGDECGRYQGTGTNNTFYGYHAQRNTGAYNVSGVVALGYMSGYTSTTSNRLIIENSSDCDYPLIDGSFADHWVELNAGTSETTAIQELFKLSHTTSGTAAALFGVSSVHLLEDGAGNEQTASEIATLWADATSGSESPLLRATTYPAGSAGPGYSGFWTWNDLDNTSRTVIPNGTGDVTSGITVVYRLSESGGGTEGGIVTVDNNDTVDLYDDGTDVCTLTVAADGSVTIARSAGAATFDVVLNMVWI